MKIFTKPETINITLKSKDNSQPSRTISVIVPERVEPYISEVKDEVQKRVIQPLTEDTKQSIYIRYRKASTDNIGSIVLKTTKSVDEVYNYILSLNE